MNNIIVSKSDDNSYREHILHHKDGIILKIRESFSSNESNNFFQSNNVINCIDKFLEEIAEYLKTNTWEKNEDGIGTEEEKEWVPRYAATYLYTISVSLDKKLNKDIKSDYQPILYDDNINKYIEGFQNNMKKLEDDFNDELNDNRKKELNDQTSDTTSQDINNKILTNTQAEPQLNQENIGQREPSGELQKEASPKPTGNEQKVSRVDQGTLKKSQISLFTLPNAKVGVNYKERLIDQSKMDPYEYEVIINPPNMGLTYNKEDGFVSGNPVSAGDIGITIRYRQRNPNSWNEWGFQIYANPDPSSLWKDLPTDPSAPYQKENSEVGAWNLCDKKIIAASQRGRSHSQEGKFRDDHFLVHKLGEDTCIIAVADGAGSAQYSREGSKIACETALKSIEEDVLSLYPILDLLKGKKLEDIQELKTLKNTLYNVLGGAGLKAYNAIRKEAQNNQAKPRDYATTLIISVAKKIWQGWFVGAFWVGDGGVGVYRRGESVNLLGEPDGGEFSGQTRFLTSTEIWGESQGIYNRVRYVVVDDFTAVVLMTDGVSDPKFEAENNLKNIKHWDLFWDDLSQGINFNTPSNSAKKELLKWLDFWSPGNHDDRTIAIMY